MDNQSQAKLVSDAEWDALVQRHIGQKNIDAELGVRCIIMSTDAKQLLVKAGKKDKINIMHMKPVATELVTAGLATTSRGWLRLTKAGLFAVDGAREELRQEGLL